MAKKYWIQDALSGGKNVGALRRTAKKKGLLRSDSEKLSKTDLKKLQRMGGKTAKRAHLAETLSKFGSGGVVSPEGYVFVKIGSHRARHYAELRGIEYTSLYSFGLSNYSAGQSINLMSEKDFQKIKDVKGVSLVKKLKGSKSDWMSRGESSKLHKVFREFRESNRYEGGGNIEVANTILQQLGGRGRLSMMVGAYNFIALSNGVSFRIKNPKANYVKIVLTPSDLYDLEVGRIRGSTYKVVFEQRGIYVDMLKKSIEKATGMYLSLYSNGGGVDEKEDVIDKINKNGKLVRYIDARGDGVKVFDTIIPNKEKKGYYKRYESRTKGSLGVLQSEYLDENDVRNWVKKTKPKFVKDSGEKFAEGGNADELMFKSKKLNMTLQHKVMSKIKSGLISVFDLNKILKREPKYPQENIGSITLEKAFLRPYYKLINKMKNG